MFAQYTTQEPRKLYGYAAFSIAAHALVIGALIILAGKKATEKLAQMQEVAFIHAKAAPPPPPPPPAKHTSTVKKTQIIPTKVEPKPIEVPKEIPKEEPPAKEEPEDKGEEGGVEGGVPGGVKGGVVGGVVGSDGDAAAPPKPKNVPAFKMQAEIVAQPKPRLSEVFKQSHRNSGPISGLYKVCVGMDGHVYEVATLKPVPGADEDIVSTIKEGWLYKPQQVPVCFLYNMQITITQ
jgi:protein TonB